MSICRSEIGIEYSMINLQNNPFLFLIQSLRYFALFFFKGNIMGVVLRLIILAMNIFSTTAGFWWYTLYTTLSKIAGFHSHCLLGGTSHSLLEPFQMGFQSSDW